MQSILFLKELRLKGVNYSQIWLSLLMELELEFKNSQDLKLVIPKEVAKSTFHRIVDFGIKIFPKYFTEISVIKRGSQLTFELATVSKKTEEKCLPIEIEKTPILDKKTKVEPITVKISEVEIISEEAQIKIEPTVKKKAIQAKVTLDTYESIINYLNECTGQSFKPNSKANQTFINARMKEGYTIDDFKKVIFIKSTKWLNTKMQDFLRPQTLFSNKFEGYLNESIIVEQTNQQKNYDQAIKATELGWNTTS